jgi:cell division septal protein FtsQ
MYQYRTIAFKVILIVSIILTILIAAWGAVLIISDYRLMQEQIDLRGNTITRTSAVFCQEALVNGNHQALQEYIEQAASIDREYRFCTN